MHRGVHLSPQVHQENIFRRTSSHRTPAESGQESLPAGKEQRDSFHTESSQMKEGRGKGESEQDWTSIQGLGN